MILTLKTSAMDPIIELLDEGKAKDSLVSKRYWYGNNRETFDLEVEELNIEETKRLRDYLRSIRVSKYVKKLNAYINALENLDGECIESVEIFCKALKEYVSKLEHKWLFRSNDKYNFMIPYFVYNVTYIPEKYDRNGYFEEAYVSMEIHTNGLDGYEKSLISFTMNCISNRTVSKILFDKGFVCETKELYEEYCSQRDKYLVRLNEFKKQYKASSCYNNKETSFWSRQKESPTDKDTNKYFRVVNSCKYDDRRIVTKENCCICCGECEVPVLPFIPVFNLDKHKDMYCHIEDIEDYVYDKSLKDKLILPESHKNLLDILVNSIDIIKGDIVDNKGNGTVIILEGPPGCGKTLSTEVYSEILEKPLYRVSTGQLGVDSSKIEENLRKVLNRAERLDCLLLIDECETFVRSRGLDIQQNAIVTTFLRTIEYFDGIMFLTSNKIKDIDDAILSRCVAAVSYKAPSKEDSKKIWKVLLKQFNLEKDMSDETLEHVVNVFPSAVGRDIKELLKLTTRYCSGNNLPMDIEAFVSCAQFRYIDIDNEEYEKIKHSK